MPGGAKNTVRPLGAKPLRLQDRAAKFFYAGSEGSLSHAWMRAGADTADAAALEDELGHRPVFVALGATDSMAVSLPKPFGLKDFASKLLNPGPELCLASK